ncbi:MAG: glycoside hydrolase family 2 TIM barrel-domain containing protein, partial [Eubacteriales bacterium]
MQILINDGWSFVKLPSGSTFDDAEKAVFEPVDLPHDWLIWQETELYESADAWYRRTIELPADHDPEVLIRFDGVYMDCDILLNGTVICTHPYGYTAFDVSLTGRLREGKNTLAVHIRHRSPNSRWYSGSGIFRDVFLVILPEEHILPDSLYTAEKEKDGKWVLDVSAELAGSTVRPFQCVLTDAEGRVAAEASGICSNGKANAVLTVPDGHTWSPEDPYLYWLTVTYGQHTEKRRIGLRSVLLDPDRGFLLNGKALKLKGVCLHHDLGALGAAFHEKAAERQLKLMKDMGANAVRTSHNPPASRFLDLCDEMGILVVDEAFDMWERPKTEFDYARFFPQWFRQDVASWIRRDRLHPCVIMWSVGNEIYDIHADIRGTEVTKMLTEQVRIHDPERHAFTTFGCNYMPWEGGQRCAECVDAVGYNYGEKLYETHHAAHPSWVIYGSETASVLSSRGIYHFPAEQSIMSDADRQCSALGNSNTSWGAESLKKILADDLRQTFSMGQFIWSGIDYIGEPTPYHTRSCYFGQADTACFPKDPYYLFQSYWAAEKMIHIGVSWDWNPGQMIDIPVITNCCEAELFLNGESLGRKKPDLSDPESGVPVWKQPYRPGELYAVGYGCDGRVICEDRRFSSDDTEHLSLACENPFLLSDGWDLAFVTVSARDREGRPVENARDRVKITVSGGGRLIGTDNGDSTDPDGYKSDCRRLFSGKLLLIIASNGLEEDALIQVKTADGKEASLTIPVRRVPVKPGISCLQQAYSRDLPETVHARKVCIVPLGSTALTPDNPECRFSYSVLPANADAARIAWQVTNAAGIESPYVEVITEKDTVTVRASGDGAYYLRALCTEGDSCTFISQTEFTASGLGSPALDPYSYISAGLYDLHEGEIGAGNEKGIAFQRDGESMAGFSRVDFGKTGSDTITVDIFALNGDVYDL